MPDGQLFQPEMPEEESKKHKIFGRKEEAAPVFVDNMGALSGELSSVNRRVRVLEERYSNLRRKSQVTEQNMLTTNKKIISDSKTLTTEVSDINKEIDLIKSTLRQIIEELKKMAKKEDVKVLEKYINIWEPIKFVTHAEVEKIIKEIIGERKE